MCLKFPDSHWALYPNSSGLQVIVVETKAIFNTPQNTIYTQTLPLSLYIYCIILFKSGLLPRNIKKL